MPYGEGNLWKKKYAREARASASAPNANSGESEAVFGSGAEGGTRNEDQISAERKQEFERAVGEFEARMKSSEEPKEAINDNTEQEESVRSNVHDGKQQEEAPTPVGGVEESRFKEVAPPEREALTRTEEAYLTAYKEFHANKRVLNIREPKEVKDLKRAYDEARFGYAKALESSVKERLGAPTKKTGKALHKWEQMSKKEQEAYQEKLQNRYNSWIRFNEVVKPAAEKKLEARVE